MKKDIEWLKSWFDDDKSYTGEYVKFKINHYRWGDEVEKEQKYYVIFPSMDENGKGFNYLAKDAYHNELWIEDSRTDGLDWEERSSFTEDEIRDLDKGDILFEHFAVKVAI